MQQQSAAALHYEHRSGAQVTWPLWLSEIWPGQPSPVHDCAPRQRSTSSPGALSSLGCGSLAPHSSSGPGALLASRDSDPPPEELSAGAAWIGSGLGGWGWEKGPLRSCPAPERPPATRPPGAPTENPCCPLTPLHHHRGGLLPLSRVAPMWHAQSRLADARDRHMDDCMCMLMQLGRSAYGHHPTLSLTTLQKGHGKGCWIHTDEHCHVGRCSCLLQ